MSPSSVPVVCRATSGAQSPSAGGRIVPHHRIAPAKASAKRRRPRQRARVKRATIVARAPRATRPQAAALAHSGSGSRNHNAAAVQALKGAMAKADAQTGKIAAAAALALILVRTQPRPRGRARRTLEQDDRYKIKNQEIEPPVGRRLRFSIQSRGLFDLRGVHRLAGVRIGDGDLLAGRHFLEVEVLGHGESLAVLQRELVLRLD